MIHWNVAPEIFTVGSFGLRWYSVLFAAAFLWAHSIVRRCFEREKLTLADLDRVLVVSMVGTVIGARLGHCLFYEPEIYLSDPLRILKVWEGGLASHGGTVGIILGYFYLVKKYKKFTFRWILDRCAIGVAAGASLIRLGNFFNSEIIGNPTSLPWAVIFERVDLEARHPAQLYESLVYLNLYFLLKALYGRTRFREWPGFIFGLEMVIIYGSRILIEKVKVNQAAFEEGLVLNMGQMLSIPFVIAGLLLIWCGRKFRYKSPAEISPI